VFFVCLGGNFVIGCAILVPTQSSISGFVLVDVEIDQCWSDFDFYRNCWV
jgi:hypothetical protein